MFQKGHTGRPATPRVACFRVPDHSAAARLGNDDDWSKRCPMRAPEMLGVAGDCERGFGRRLEQEILDHGLILVGDVGDWAWQREHHVEVWHGQQLGLALGEPLICGGTLTLRAMPIAAAVVGNEGRFCSGRQIGK
jgi:hypothetical protein